MRTLAWLTLLGTLLGCGGEDAPDGPTCGDGQRTHDEFCDDGNRVDGDGCAAACAEEQGFDCTDPGGPQPDACMPRCGDGLVVGSEVCEVATEPYCQACQAVVGSCGDGTLQSHEGCDAGGNAMPGCIACQTRFGWRCSGAPSTCIQSGLPPELLIEGLDAAQTRAFCEWIVAVFGGEDASHRCGDLIYTTDSAEMCVIEFGGRDYGACTVGDWEADMATFEDICSYTTAPIPACITQ